MVPPGPSGDAVGGEERGGWGLSFWRPSLGTPRASSASSAFPYETIGEQQDSEEENACRSNSRNAKRTSRRRRDGGVRGPLQRVINWGGVLCAIGLIVIANETRRDLSTPPPPLASSPASPPLSGPVLSSPPLSSPSLSQSKTANSRDTSSREDVLVSSRTGAASPIGSTVDKGEDAPPSTPTSTNAGQSDEEETSPGITHSLLSSSPSSSIDVRLSNKYGTTNTRQGQQLKVLYPWAHIAEPHVDTLLKVLNVKGDESVGLTYRWEMDGTVLGYGAAITTVFTATGLFNCSVTAYHNSVTSSNHGNPGTPSLQGSALVGKSVTTQFEVAVKYVRREIRSLTDRDREVFFNAMSVMQRVPTSVGRAIYGPGYYSKDYLNRIHLYYGGAKSCDHWHAGPGFVTTHIALSLMFEQSLQTIDPSIALPYWDFTIEGMHFDWTNFRSSSVFSDDWFGYAAPINDLKTPERGRFAFVPAMVDATEFSQHHNAYGMLRAAWNNDPTPFVTRHDHELGYTNNKKPSGCEEYRDALLVDNWMELTMWLNRGAHGHIHELLGGSWSQQATAFAKQKKDITQLFAHNSTPLQRYLWRAGYLDGPSKCTMDQTWEECKAVCLDSACEGKTAVEILMDAGILADGVFYDKNFTYIDNLVNEQGGAFEAFPGYTKEETDEIYEDMLTSLCVPMKIGTHYEATSTNDPTFWVIHPTFDRLWHLNRLENRPTFDQRWRIDETACYGHNPGDMQPFHDLFPLSDTAAATTATKNDDGISPGGDEIGGAKVYYTNEELYAKLSPDEVSMPYMYENFEWTHCETQDIFVRVPH